MSTISPNKTELLRACWYDGMGMNAGHCKEGHYKPVRCAVGDAGNSENHAGILSCRSTIVPPWSAKVPLPASFGCHSEDGAVGVTPLQVDHRRGWRFRELPGSGLWKV